VKNKRAIVGLLALTALAPSCGSSSPSKVSGVPIPKWQTQQRVPTSSDLRAVNFAGSTVGIIAGKDGSIFRTNDGGFSWIQLDFTPANRTGDIAALAGLNSKVVAVGADAGGAKDWESNDSRSFVTDDAAGTGAPYTDVALGAVSAGPGNPVEIYRLRRDGLIDITLLTGGDSTANSGTWTNANAIINILSEDFKGTYVLGDEAGAGKIILASNGAIYPCTLPANMKTFRRATVSTNNRPFACGDNTSNNGVVVTLMDPTDPTAWSLVPGNPSPGTTPSFNAISSVSTDGGSYVYAVGNNGAVWQIIYSIAANTWTWTNLNPGGALTTENLHGVHFRDQDRGWIVGDKGTVLRVTSASSTPSLQKLNGGEAGIAWNAMAFSNDGQRGIAVGNLTSGNTARIYRTTNGGASWSAMALPAGLTTETLYGVSVPRTSGNGATAYICGSGGKVYRNTAVWSTGLWNNTGITGLSGAHTYRAILFPGAGDKGVLVGDGGGPVLLRTSDGLAWVAPTFNTATAPSASYNALSSNPAGTAIYASGGTNGAIAVSTDQAGGWDSWANVSTPTGLATTLNSIQSPEGVFFKAIVAAADGSVYRLDTTGTPAWTAQNLPTPWGSAKPLSLGFQGDLNGMVVTDAGGVFHTLDGGVTWTQTYPHTKTKPRTVWMSPTVPGLGYIGCDDGVIMRTISSGE
jgi:photosystem II stability/assembly factor-like uncharacterized protein